MADQKIGVILDFKANTSQAKQSMAQLQQYLTQISSGANLNVNSASIQTASKAAKELAYHLSAAYNADTGKLDLGKLNASLNSAKANIGDLSSRLLQAGATGQQAFVQLAKSMSMAEAPAFRLNGVVSKLWTSLKNVATWQISSTVLMGFMSSISEAYQFAQDLNESLNEIRIVTGNSAEEMQRFAKEANKAAKALSTTTTKYTDASLIYFQQGLNEKQVKERTDLTIKMANVTGQSVSEVSDQLTAVWNNFDNGTKTLEYYVDVMTALGAATASSSEEISEGLNKFAAVAETVGLSYEYAAAALATVTATTRQSADIVGTAFKTLFARIQDLELGETLDDGTTMGQYSQALAAVGINIKDVNGEVKDMNIILDEMGAKWNTLTKDTQIALAQNVAGVRQYTQLIALMDNWSYFQENLNTAYTSTGELQNQADIYAESWEAARDRVTASLEDIYQDVLKDDFFIDLLNGIADVTEGVDTFIEKLGGIEPIIIGLSSLLLNSISNKIQPAIYGIISSIRSITPTGAANEAAKASKPMVDKIDNQLATSSYNQSDRTALENSKQLLQVKNQLWARQKDMTDAEKQMAQIDLDLIEKKQSELQTTADIIVKMQEKIAVQKEINIASKLESDFKKSNIVQEELLRKKITETKTAYDKQNNIVQNFPKLIKEQEAAISRLKVEQDKTNEGTKAHLKLQNRIVEEEKKLIELKQTLRQTENLGLRGQAYEAYQRANEQLNEFVNKNSIAETVISKTGQAMVEAYQQAGQAAAAAGEQTTQAFLEGKSTIGLGSISESFFADNKDVFDAVGTKKAYSTINAKNALGSFRGVLGEDIMSQNDNRLGKLFDNAQSATNGQQLKIVIGEIRKALQETNVSVEQFENNLRDFGDVGEEAINGVKNPLQDLDNQYKKIAKQQEQLNAQIKNFQPKHIATGTEIFTKMTSGITSTVMALNGLSAIVRQLKESGPPDTFEEWMSIITSATFILPQMLNAWKGLGGGIVAVMGKMNGSISANIALMALSKTTYDAAGKETGEMTMLELYNTAAKKAGTKATEAQIKSEIAKLAVEKQLVTETESQAFAETILNAAKQKGTIWSGLQTAADKGSASAKRILSLAQKANIVSINAETGAVIVNTAAWYANPITWIAAIIIAVVAAIAALTIAIVNNNKALNADAEAAKKANEALKNQIEIVNELKNAYDGLKQSINSYTETQKNIDAMIEGTQEWKEAVLESNKAVSDLMNKYPELAKYVNSVNGRLTIAQEGLDLIQEKEYNSLQAGYSAQYSAQIQANQANIRAKQTNFAQNEGDLFTSADYWKEGLHGLGAGAAVGAAAGLIAGPVGAAVGGVMGGVIGTLSAVVAAGNRDIEAQEEMTSALSEMTEEYKENDADFIENYNQIAAKIADGNEELYKTLLDNSDKITELVSSESELEKSNQILRQEIAKNTLALLNKEDKPSIYDDMVATQAAVYLSPNNSLYKSHADTVKALSIETLSQEYLKAQGMSDTHQIITEDDKLVLQTYQNGAWTTIGTLYEDNMREFVAQQRTLEEINRDNKEYFKYNAKGIVSDLKTAGFTRKENESDEEFLRRLTVYGNQFLSGENINLKDLGYQEVEQVASVLSVKNELMQNSELAKIMAESIAKYYDTYTTVNKQQTSDYVKEFETEEASQRAKTYTAAGLDAAGFSYFSNEFVQAFRDNAADIAEQALIISNGMDKVRTAIDEASEGLASGNIADPKFIAAIGEIRTSLTDWLGVDLGYEYTVNNLELITAATNGSAQAIKSLSFAAAEMQLQQFGLSKEAEDSMNSFISSIQALDKGGKLVTGANAATMGLADSMYHLSYYAKQGESNLKQLDLLFKSMGFELAYLTDAAGNFKEIDWTNTLFVGFDEGAKLAKASAEDAKGKLEDEIERYHEVNEQLDDIKRELDAIGKAKDRAFGASKIALINKELIQMGVQLDKEKQKLDEIEQYFDKDRDTLIKYGASTDAAGRVTNYDALVTNWYNNLSSEEYKKRIKALERYEETLNLLEDQKETIIGIGYSQQDLRLEKIEYEIEVEVKVADNELEYLEYQIEKLDDPIDDAVDALTRLGEIADLNLNKVDSYNKGIQNVLKDTFSDEEIQAILNGNTGILVTQKLTESQIAALEEYRSALYESNNSLEEFYTNIQEKVVSALEASNKELEKNGKSLDRYNSILDTYKNVIDLVGTKSLGLSAEAMRELGQAQIVNAKATLQNLEAQRAAAATNLAELKAAKEARQGEATEEENASWDAMIEAAEEKFFELEESVNSAWGDTLQAIADDFAESVEITTKTFEEAMTGIYGSYEKMQEAFNQQSEIGDRYVEDYQKIYELSKLNRDITASIDSNDSIKGKQALRDLQKEINALQESDTEMSQHDLDYLRKKYELRVAEIALEEAQSAKSQVRMQRDSEGNWSYVYTADQDNIAKAQQNFEDKLYEIQELEQNYIDEMQERVIQAEVDMIEAINALRAEDFATQEDYQAEVTRITEYYTGMRNYYLDELNTAIGNSQNIYETDWNQYSKLTDYKISKEAKWRDSFKETEYAMVTGYPNIETARSNFESNTNTMLTTLTANFITFKEHIVDTFKALGKSLNGEEEGSFKNALNKAVENSNEETSKITGSLEKMGQIATDKFKAIVDAANNNYQQYSSKIGEYIGENDKLIESLNNIIAKYAEVTKTETGNNDTTDYTHTGNDGEYYQDGQQDSPSSPPPKTPPTSTNLTGNLMDRSGSHIEKSNVTISDLTVEELRTINKNRIGNTEYFTWRDNNNQYEIHEDQLRLAMSTLGIASEYFPNKETLLSDGPEEQTYNNIPSPGDRIRVKNQKSTSTSIIAYQYNPSNETMKNMGDDFIFSPAEMALSGIGGEENYVKEVRRIGHKNYITLQNGYYAGFAFFDADNWEKFDTGGYTGSWDSSGRLAMLHQKEIVLNAHDTENFLQAINIVRDIASMIDLRAAAQQSALSMMAATSVAPMTQTLQQEVTIHAEFPNATQRTEIEAAFDTLLNRASQFANRKN